MKLPNGANAEIDDRKLMDYVPNPEHPRQAGHAELFKRLLGIDRSNAEVLRSALLKAAADADARPGKASPYGEKFEVRFPLIQGEITYNILSVWIIDAGQTIPRLVTAFVE